MEDRRLERPLREKGIEKKKLNHNTQISTFLDEHFTTVNKKNAPVL